MIAITLSVMFGLGWGIGLLATQALYTTAVRETFSILFILLTAFQGLFIFIMHCARATEVVNQWKKWLTCVTARKSEIISSSDKACHPQSSTNQQIQLTTLSGGKETLQTTSKWQHATTASKSDEFSFTITDDGDDDDDDGISTPRQNIAKSGIPSRHSTHQCIPKSLPKMIAEKEMAAELDDVENLAEDEATTTFKMPVHVLVNDGFEKVKELPAVSHSISNPSLQPTTSETDAHETSLYNPLYEQTQF